MVRAGAPAMILLGGATDAFVTTDRDPTIVFCAIVAPLRIRAS